MSKTLVHSLFAFLALVLLVFLSVTAVLEPVFDAVRLGTNFLAFPLVAAFERADKVFTILGELRNLAAENRVLEQQVAELSAELAALERAKEENRFLREALGFRGDSRLDLVAAEVIALDPLSVDQKMTLDRGRRDGIAEGAAVVAPGGVLIGVVTAAFDHTSQMDLLTSSAVVVNAEVVPGGANGLVKGEHGLGLSFDLISQTEVVQPGDRVVTSGLGGQFPRNLLIGEVGSISSSESELFQKASLIPAVKLRAQRFVFVTKK